MIKPLDAIILNAEKILLTNNDILEKTNNKVRIVVYEELVNYKSIDDVFDGYDGIVILYENTRSSGHWCLLYKINPKTLYFFDPYGFQMDTEIKWSNYLVQQGFLNHPNLTFLIKNSPYKLQQNNVKYQLLKNGINTCGRWVICRFNYRHLKDKEFQTFMLGNQHYSGDFWVSVLTM